SSSKDDIYLVSLTGDIILLSEGDVTIHYIQRLLRLTLV
ncbi:hypothetical protein LCGC14_2594890, partial [marine sediment metagenome]